jgi:hypothetical protein
MKWGRVCHGWQGQAAKALAESSFMTTMISFQNDWTIFFRHV